MPQAMRLRRGLREDVGERSARANTSAARYASASTYSSETAPSRARLDPSASVPAPASRSSGGSSSRLQAPCEQVEALATLVACSAAAKKTILRSSGRPSRSRASSFEPGGRLSSSIPFGMCRAGNCSSSGLGEDEVEQPARRHDDLQPRARVDGALHPPQDGRRVAAQARVLLEVRAAAAPELPALAVERVRDVAGHRPLVVQQPDDRAAPAQQRQRGEAEVAPVQVVELDDVGGAEPRIDRKPNEEGIKGVLQREGVEHAPGDAVGRAPGDVPLDLPDLVVGGRLPPHEHPRAMAEPVQAAVDLVGSAGGTACGIGLRDVENGQSHEGASIGFRFRAAVSPCPNASARPSSTSTTAASSVVRLRRCRI